MTTRPFLTFEDIVRLSVRFALILSHPNSPTASDQVRRRLDHLLDEIAPVPARFPNGAPLGTAVPGAVLPDAIISLEDGQPYKDLYDHLNKLGLDPKAYRRKWGLPPKYPMMAPNEVERRRRLRECCGPSPCRRRRRRRSPRHCP
jgi:predicted transcriptional regulator